MYTINIHITSIIMKTFKQFISDAWVPPASKKLRGGKESPLSAARKKGTNVDLVKSSVHRYSQNINDPRHPDFKHSVDNKSGDHVFTHSKQPIEVRYSQGNEPNTFVQNTRTIGDVENRVSAARAMQSIKTEVSKKLRPGTIVQSQPVGTKRERLNMKSQGMGAADSETGTQAGVARHRSPRQLAKNKKPLDPL